MNEKDMNFTHGTYNLLRQEVWKQMAAINVKCSVNTMYKMFLKHKMKAVKYQSTGFNVRRSLQERWDLE